MQSTHEFGRVTATALSQMFSVPSQATEVQFSREGVVSQKSFLISIMFTGMVFGEFIVALNNEVAAQLLGKSFQGITSEESTALTEEITEIFCELLNIIVGSSIAPLNKIYQKITMTTPRVCFGQMKYPKVKAAKTIVMTAKGEVECHLYIDQMMLDLANSYQQSLTELMISNEELNAALNKLKTQAG